MSKLSDLMRAKLEQTRSTPKYSYLSETERQVKLSGALPAALESMVAGDMTAILSHKALGYAEWSYATSDDNTFSQLTLKALHRRGLVLPIAWVVTNYGKRWTNPVAVALTLRGESVAAGVIADRAASVFTVPAEAWSDVISPNCKVCCCVLGFGLPWYCYVELDRAVPPTQVDGAEHLAKMKAIALDETPKRQVPKSRMFNTSPPPT